MPQILTSISSKAERLEQIRAIKQIELNHKPSDTVQLMHKGEAITIPIRVKQ